MSKAVLFSTRPKYCELIASDKKTIEVRKTRPKLETPFKGYIYCTSVKNMPLSEYVQVHRATGGMVDDWHDKVIGEFVCDRMTSLFNVATTPWRLLSGDVHERAKGLVGKACLTEEELLSYAKGKNCYGLHIADLKIYDTPKELGEFKTPSCEKPEDYCHKCKYFVKHDTPQSYETDCWGEDGVPLNRPPQSWQYVEEI